MRPPWTCRSTGGTPRWADAFAPLRGRGARPGPRRHRIQPSAASLYRRRRAARPALRQAAPRRRRPRTPWRPSATGSRSAPEPGEGTRHDRSDPATPQPFLAQGRRRAHRAAGRGRQHRRRLHRDGARPRLQPAPARTLPGAGERERRHAAGAAEQGGPLATTRGRAARREPRHRARRRRLRRERARRPRRRHRPRGDFAGADRRAARQLGSREVDAHQRAARATRCSPLPTCAPPTRAAGTPRVIGSSCRCRAAACSSTRRACASCSCGRCPRRRRPASKTSTRWRTGATSPTASIAPSRAAPCARPPPTGALDASRLESFHKLQDEARALGAKQDVRERMQERAQAKTIARSLRQLYRSRDRS